ncbi:hypothetical protein Aduo_019519 [Ancylostoma duodenale]
METRASKKQKNLSKKSPQLEISPSVDEQNHASEQKSGSNDAGQEDPTATKGETHEAPEAAVEEQNPPEVEAMHAGGDSEQQVHCCGIADAEMITRGMTKKMQEGEEASSNGVKPKPKAVFRMTLRSSNKVSLRKKESIKKASFADERKRSKHINAAKKSPPATKATGPTTEMKEASVRSFCRLFGQLSRDSGSILNYLIWLSGRKNSLYLVCTGCLEILQGFQGVGVALAAYRPIPYTRCFIEHTVSGVIGHRASADTEDESQLQGRFPAQLRIRYGSSQVHHSVGTPSVETRAQKLRRHLSEKPAQLEFQPAVEPAVQAAEEEAIIKKSAQEGAPTDEHSPTDDLVKQEEEAIAKKISQEEVSADENSANDAPVMQEQKSLEVNETGEAMNGSGDYGQLLQSSFLPDSEDGSTSKRFLEAPVNGGTPPPPGPRAAARVVLGFASVAVSKKSKSRSEQVSKQIHCSGVGGAKMITRRMARRLQEKKPIATVQSEEPALENANTSDDTNAAELQLETDLTVNEILPQPSSGGPSFYGQDTEANTSAQPLAVVKEKPQAVDDHPMIALEVP